MPAVVTYRTPLSSVSPPQTCSLVGFVVMVLPRRLPAHVGLALADASDELALALAHRPEQPIASRDPLVAAG